MITTLPYAHDMKPGSACRPMFGVRPQLVDSKARFWKVLPAVTCVLHTAGLDKLAPFWRS